ncbi:AAA family ATPase [Candidatus Woesebacteria bacterium]|jgi:ATP-dependent Lon protease|nr:AAA family ATPase [Candidatus Woesebacteria bacterium]HNV44945.1 AAA family ATPase [Candidatus Woesebacteria bacterium]HOA11678.1 AAA family ATPase [Candidatus Woesebacteria bacterium]HOC07426.1 AAA family ATPase [Candidatus Woesebacteria bacterium]HOP38911.1 AAA family ATPase [Candidatus Woesebacteria bacterium]
MSELNSDEILNQELDELRAKIKQVQLPEELQSKLEKELVFLERSAKLGNYDEKYDKVSRYLDWVTKIPFGKKSEDTLDIQQAKVVLDEHHYGLKEVKDRFLEYLAILNLQKQNFADQEFSAPVLLLVGLVGTGKTTFAYSLAEALNRQILRIPVGGMASAKELRGESRLILEAQPGAVIQGLCTAQTMNPVILLDEIDRSAEEANNDIMGVLVELLDPAQNHAFVDNYINYPVDLSQAIFIATCNNTRRISAAVLDRMERIDMPSYSDEEKIVIAKKYILPEILKEAGLKENQFKIDEAVWPKLVRPLGFDAGVRTLQRTLKGAVRKAARIIVERGFEEVVIKPDNVKIFLPSY